MNKKTKVITEKAKAKKRWDALVAKLPPLASPPSPQSAGKTIVLAGNFHQFYRFVQEQSPANRKAFIHGNEIFKMQGVEADHVIEIGTFSERHDAAVLRLYAKSRLNRVTPPMPAATSTVYVAVVHKAWQTSGRPEGDWASFVNKNKKDAIAAAQAAQKKWEAKGYGPYQIWVGTLTEEVKVPTTYELEPLAERKLNLFAFGTPYRRDSWYRQYQGESL